VEKVEYSAVCRFDLSCFGLTVQAALFDSVGLNPFASEQDAVAASEMGVGRGGIVEAHLETASDLCF